MSYRSRVYRQRNATSPDEVREQPFFSSRNDVRKSNNNPGFFQAKLSVNSPGDSYEQEADSMARAVASKNTNMPMALKPRISGIQRLSSSMEDEKLGTNDARMKRDKDIQTKSLDEPQKEEDKKKGIQKKSTDEPQKEEDKMKGIQKKDDPIREEEKNKSGNPVQTKAETNSTASPQVASRIESSVGKGNPMPSKTQHEMNSAFGIDFSSVRIHNDSESAGMSAELRAQAFTHGNDIYFNQGKFNPEQTQGKTLLAHELTHVVQQGGGRDSKKIQRAPDDGSAKQCGPDIKDPLMKAQLKTRSHFGAWNNDQKETACQHLVSIFYGPFAWDIIDLNESDWISDEYGPACASEGATPSCTHSVKVDNECFYSGSVNYVHFGNMFDLCQSYYSVAYPLNNQFSENEMLSWINLYKGTGLTGLSTPKDNFKSSCDWASAGFFNWPHGALTPSGDRKACSPSCPTAYKGSGFTVNWDGENF